MKLFTAILVSVALALCSCTTVSPSDEINMPVPPTHTEAEVEVIPEKEAVPDSEPIPEPEPVIERVSFMGCGDNIIYYGNTRDAKKLAVAGGREYNFKPMFEKISDKIASADVSFINQETLMAGEGYSISYYPHFNSPQDLGYDLAELGFDVVNIANNHMLDKGTDGLYSTIKFWKGMEPLMIGGYESPEDYDDIRVLEKNGIKIAFLSYAEHTNGLSKRADASLVIPSIIEDDIVRQAALARQKADLVAVSVHWGDEGAFSPNDLQKKTAQLFADCGVDVILGHHPHVIQPVEWIEGKDGNKTLCVYSLGNIAAEQSYDYNMVGGIIEFDIVSVNDGKAYIENVIFNPTVFHFPSNFYNNTIYLMSDYTPSLAAVHGVKGYYAHKLTYEGLVDYAVKTIAEEFLPESFLGRYNMPKAENVDSDEVDEG